MYNLLIMSKEYEGQDPLDIALQAERDLNSSSMKTGAANQGSDSSTRFVTSVEAQFAPPPHIANPSFPFLSRHREKSCSHLSQAQTSGVDESVENKFPGAKVSYRPSGGGDNRVIPVEEGGDIQRGTGKPTKAKDFDQGEVGEGPEHVYQKRQYDQGGENDDDVPGLTERKQQQGKVDSSGPGRTDGGLKGP